MKKAQGLPFNVIIMAVIAIVVLVILLAIFQSKTSDISEDLSSCFTKGGACLPLDGQCDQIIPDVDCGEERICCINLKS